MPQLAPLLAGAHTRCGTGKGIARKVALASAALLGLSLAPVAYAQISCSDVNRLIEESDVDFEDIAGEEIDDYLYRATFRIAGANSCEVDLDFDAVYYCDWQYQSYGDASAALSSQVAALGYCLSSSGWSAPKSLKTDSAADSDGYRTIAGTYWEGTGSNLDLEWAVELEEHRDSNGMHYHLWIDLVYYYF
jgi:hypothetical protein